MVLYLNVCFSSARSKWKEDNVISFVIIAELSTVSLTVQSFWTVLSNWYINWKVQTELCHLVHTWVGLIQCICFRNSSNHHSGTWSHQLLMHLSLHTGCVVGIPISKTMLFRPQMSDTSMTKTGPSITLWYLKWNYGRVEETKDSTIID